MFKLKFTNFSNNSEKLNKCTLYSYVVTENIPSLTISQNNRQPLSKWVIQQLLKWLIPSFQEWAIPPLSKWSIPPLSKWAIQSLSKWLIPPWSKWAFPIPMKVVIYTDRRICSILW